MNFLKYIILLSLNITNGFIISKFRSLIDFSFLNPENILKDEKIISETSIYEYKDIFSFNWYVIGESGKFPSNRIKKITVWNKDYTVWKDSKTKQFYAMDDDCSHKGAALSGGYLNKGCAVCPYHGYEFAGNGTLVKIPGLEFTNTPCKNQITYPIVEKNGWIYLNILPKQLSTIDDSFYKNSIIDEEEVGNPDFSTIFLNVGFNAYSRIVSENSLDVMHIGFVHSFGNSEFPSPLSEIPPFPLNQKQNHWRTEYDYLSGKKSFAKKLFGINQLKIQNEFALPHMTVARILFGPWISTVVTFATPTNLTHTQLYVKTYRNFWKAPVNSQNPIDHIFESLGDFITRKLMFDTVMQDKSVVESIPIEKMDGKFNMKYDKLSNTYRMFYKKWIHRVE
jgi:phenylpropionate dioxygenase-like ring-hydroxylating dioxygenase large terminal subunit